MKYYWSLSTESNEIKPPGMPRDALRDAPRRGLPRGLLMPARVGGVGGAAGLAVGGVVSGEVDLTHPAHEIGHVGGAGVLDGPLALWLTAEQGPLARRL
eukprot:9496403-Pyramimonas_sp.AAC.2